MCLAAVAGGDTDVVTVHAWQDTASAPSAKSMSPVVDRAGVLAHSDGDRDDAGEHRGGPGDLPALALGDGAAEDVLAGQRGQGTGEGEDDEGHEDRDACRERRGDDHRGGGQHLTGGAGHPQPRAHPVTSHPGHHHRLGQHRAGLADRHEHAHQHSRHSQRGEEPRQHRLGVDDLVAGALQCMGGDLAEAVGGDVTVGVVRPAGADSVGCADEPFVEAHRRHQLPPCWASSRDPADAPSDHGRGQGGPAEPQRDGVVVDDRVRAGVTTRVVHGSGRDLQRLLVLAGAGGGRR
jgi:hypothetical protein